MAKYNYDKSYCTSIINSTYCFDGYEMGKGFYSQQHCTSFYCNIGRRWLDWYNEISDDEGSNIVSFSIGYDMGDSISVDYGLIEESKYTIIEYLKSPYSYGYNKRLENDTISFILQNSDNLQKNYNISKIKYFYNGIGANIAKEYNFDLNIAKYFCDQLNISYCYEGIGRYIGWYFPNQEKLFEELCQNNEECLFGARSMMNIYNSENKPNEIDKIANFAFIFDSFE
jgi:hypothetical protein